MDWNDIQKDLKKAGKLVFAMNQGQTAPLTQPGPWGSIGAGYCFGLVVQWIASRYSGKDFPFDPTTLVCDYPPWQATRDQNVLSDNSTDKGFPAAYNLVLADYGLTFNQGRTKSFKRPLNGGDLFAAGYYDACYYIYIRGDTTAHAVAMQRLGNTWRFFDPNAGEFRCEDTIEFMAYIDWYARRAGYRELFTTETSVYCVNPPPYINADALKARTGS